MHLCCYAQDTEGVSWSAISANLCFCWNWPCTYLFLAIKSLDLFSSNCNLIPKAIERLQQSGYLIAECNVQHQPQNQTTAAINAQHRNSKWILYWDNSFHYQVRYLISSCCSLSIQSIQFQCMSSQSYTDCKPTTTGNLGQSWLI